MKSKSILKEFKKNRNDIFRYGMSINFVNIIKRLSDLISIRQDAGYKYSSYHISY